MSIIVYIYIYMKELKTWMKILLYDIIINNS